jgi:methanogenic corrinoid protein MtbC1
MVEEVLTPGQQIVGDPEFSNRASVANLMMAAPKMHRRGIAIWANPPY